MTDKTVQTNWVAITGAPSSGKTSVIDELARSGYAVQPEIARAYIEEKLAAGLSLDDVRGPLHVQRMQQEIFARAMAAEDNEEPERLLFLDRGLPDLLAYYRLVGLDTAPVAAALRHFRYRAVFQLDRLPVQHDDVRSEDDAAAQQLGEMFAADYAAAGYDVVHVPVMPVGARCDFILRKLGLPARASDVASALSTGAGMT